MVTSLGHMPGKKWAFDASVTACFEDMLERSIPQYRVMRELVAQVGACFVQPYTGIVDLGCSRGGALAGFVERFGDGNHYIGLEISQPMLAAARERFQGEIARGQVEIREWDLRHGLPVDLRPSLVLSVLTLQFIPIEYRLRIVADAYARLATGGAMILVEKILGGSARLDGIMVDLYLDLKRRNGYSEEEVQRKRAALEGVLVPVTASWNEDLLRLGGFQQVDCFWRWLNFAGWVAVKTGA